MEDKGKLAMFSEYAMDFKTGQVIVENGEMKPIFGSEAIKVWIYKALNPQSIRFCHPAHTAQYGNELNTLPGGGMPAMENRVAKIVRDALLVNPYIESVENFYVSRSKEGVFADFTVTTVYGDFDFQKVVL